MGTEPELTEDEIKDQEFKMINPDDLESEELIIEESTSIVNDNPTTENNEIIEA